MMETLANGYSTERTQQELFNEYQQIFLRSCAFVESSLGIERVNSYCVHFKCKLVDQTNPF